MVGFQKPPTPAMSNIWKSFFRETSNKSKLFWENKDDAWMISELNLKDKPGSAGSSIGRCRSTVHMAQLTLSLQECPIDLFVVRKGCFPLVGEKTLLEY